MATKRDARPGALDVLRGNVAYLMQVRGLRMEDVAYLWGCSVPTAYRRVREPGSMQMKDLILLAQVLRCGVGELFEGKEEAVC